MAANSERRTQDVKEAIQAKKVAFKAFLEKTSSFDLQFRYSEVQKSAAEEVKNVQRTLLGGIWLVEFQLFISKQSILADHSPIAWKSLCSTISIKDSTRNILRDEEILSH